MVFSPASTEHFFIDDVYKKCVPSTFHNQLHTVFYETQAGHDLPTVG